MSITVAQLLVNKKNEISKLDSRLLKIDSEIAVLAKEKLTVVEQRNKIQTFLQSLEEEIPVVEVPVAEVLVAENLTVEVPVAKNLTIPSLPISPETEKIESWADEMDATDTNANLPPSKNVSYSTIANSAKANTEKKEWEKVTGPSKTKKEKKPFDEEANLKRKLATYVELSTRGAKGLTLDECSDDYMKMTQIILRMISEKLDIPTFVACLSTNEIPLQNFIEDNLKTDKKCGVSSPLWSFCCALQTLLSGSDNDTNDVKDSKKEFVFELLSDCSRLITALETFVLNPSKEKPSIYRLGKDIYYNSH